MPLWNHLQGLCLPIHTHTPDVAWQSSHTRVCKDQLTASSVARTARSPPTPTPTPPPRAGAPEKGPHLRGDTSRGKSKHDGVGWISLHAKCLEWRLSTPDHHRAF